MEYYGEDVVLSASTREVPVKNSGTTGTEQQTTSHAPETEPVAITADGVPAADTTSTAAVETETVTDVVITSTLPSVPEKQYDAAYRSLLGIDYGFGLTGPTELQKLQMAEEMLQHVSNGTLGDFLNNSSPTTVSAYSSVLTSLPQLLDMEQAIRAGTGNRYGIEAFADMQESDEGYQDIVAALEAEGYTAEGARAAIAALNDELLVQGVKATSMYGDMADEVVATMQDMEGGARRAAQAYKDLMSVMRTMNNEGELFSLYAAGSRDQEIISQLASAYGLEESDFYSNDGQVPSVVLKAHERQAAANLADVQADVSGYDQYITPELLATLNNSYSGSAS